jgi:hypothetical protein
MFYMAGVIPKNFSLYKTFSWHRWRALPFPASNLEGKPRYLASIFHRPRKHTTPLPTTASRFGPSGLFFECHVSTPSPIFLAPFPCLFSSLTLSVDTSMCWFTRVVSRDVFVMGHSENLIFFGLSPKREREKKREKVYKLIHLRELR